MFLSVVIPAYNEEKTIGNAVYRVNSVLSENYGDEFEIIISEDGSDDRTPEIVSGLVERFDNVKKIIGSSLNGKGGALEQALNVCRGDIFAFIDADLSPEVTELPKIIDLVKSEGYDIGIGSRRFPGHKQTRKPFRKVLSFFFNNIVRFVYSSDIYDHLIGCKAFRREVFEDIVEGVKSTSFFWDVEVVVLAQRKGYSIKEIPMEWEPYEETSFNFLTDCLLILYRIVEFKYSLIFNKN